MKVTVITVAADALRELSNWHRTFREVHPEKDLEIRAYFIPDEHLQVDFRQMDRDIRTADFALIDLMGVSEPLINRIDTSLAYCKGNILVIGYGCRNRLRLGKFSMGSGMGAQKDPGPDGQGGLKTMAKMRHMASGMGRILPLSWVRDMNNVFLLGDYWQSGLSEDIDNMMRLILRTYYGMRELPKPNPPQIHSGIYLCSLTDGTTYSSPASYWADHPAKKHLPTVAFLFYGHRYPNDLFPFVRAAAEQFEPFANVLPIAFSNQLDKDLTALRTILTGEPVRLLVNFMSFRIGAGPMGGNAAAGVELLKDLGVPMLDPFYSSKQTAEEWTASQKGAAPGDFLISMMMPELDGAVDALPVAAVRETVRDEQLGCTLTELEPLPGRLERLAGQAEAWLNLQSKPASEKKIAVIAYNYPPGEEHLFSAAFLDVFGSLPGILHALKEAGYRTEEKTAEELRDRFLQGGLLNGSRYGTDTADIFYAPASLDHEAELDRFWGPAPGTVMTGPDGYRIPGILLGNVFLGVQPCRTGGTEDAERHYHDRDLPPHYQYAAFYQWIRENFRADAVVHVGTHGTLEFLPGKDNGLSADCWPDRLLGNLPDVYYYYCGNASEAMTAKRRANAVLVTYAPPDFVQGGLYGELAELDALLAELTEAAQQAPGRVPDLRRRLSAAAAALHLPDDPDALERELYRTRTAQIPDGLHLLGQGQPGELTGLLTVLSGAYLPVGPLGDIRREPDVLPTGRNGYAFDPRFVPSEAAFRRGEELARAAMDRFRAENGRWPRRTALVLWGLETAKTHGETVGQLMYYLGLRMTWKGTSFLSRIEVIPAEEMDRPRVDVTVTICGFFRDLFPGLLADLTAALRELDERREPPEQSAFAEQTERVYRAMKAAGMPDRKARQIAHSRIFGPKDGEYGTSLTEVIQAGDWETEAELGSLFTAELGYLYGDGTEGERIPGLTELAFSGVELISQVRGDADYEITDLDHYYEFFGGLSKAVELAGGARPAAFILDSTGTSVYADTAEESAGRGVRTRILNPKWIDGMLAHPFHGGQKIADRFENMLGLAATAGCIPSSAFDRLDAVYVSDPERRAQMRENNRYAYLSAMERLMEADRRGYWEATEDQRNELMQVYLDTEGEVEDEL